MHFAGTSNPDMSHFPMTYRFLNYLRVSNEKKEFKGLLRIEIIRHQAKDLTELGEIKNIFFRVVVDFKS